MFFKKEEIKRRKNPIIAFVRLLLSLTMFTILVFFLAFAMKDFTGFDPSKLNAESSLKSLIGSDKAYLFLSQALSFNPNLGLEKIKDLVSGKTPSSTSLPEKQNKASGKKLFSFGVVSDSHNDNASLAKALKQIKDYQGSFVIGLGDYSDVGTIDELSNAKREFDGVGLSFYSTAGDHDLWESRAKKLNPTEQYQQIFGFTNSSFTHENAKIIIIYNSDNYLGLDGVEFSWLESELKRGKEEGNKPMFVFAGIPIFHPSSDHVMGKGEVSLKSQASKLLELFKTYGVSEVVAGDTHFFSRYVEPSTSIKMITVGAVTSSRNLQAPRYVLIDVYDDGGYNIEDKVIN